LKILKKIRTNIDYLLYKTTPKFIKWESRRHQTKKVNVAAGGWVAVDDWHQDNRS
jgi:hypothetical protein